VRPRTTLRRAAALLLVAAATVVVAAAPVRAADAARISAPTLTATFLQAIDVRATATVPAGVVRIEARLRYGEDPVIDVVPLAVPEPGDRTLRYLLPTPSGSLMPNTLVRARFRVVLADGTWVDGPEGEVRYGDTRLAWRTVSGPLVRLHWTEGDAAFGARALAIAEAAVAKTSALLGVTETLPIDLFVYSDPAQFSDVLGPAVRENVGGVAFAEIRTMFARILPQDLDAAWVGIVIPHELAHLVFQTAVQNPYRDPPHWLNEGLADYLARGDTPEYRAMVAAAVADGTLMPLRALTGQFPTTAEGFALGYAESVSAIDHLVATYGQPALVALIRSYAEGITDDEAFTRALGVDEAGFEASWYAALGARTPTARGPQDAPLGPIPSGWSAPTWTPAPGPTPAAGASGDTVDVGDGLLPLSIGLGVAVAAGLALLVLRARRNRRRGPWA
jgi:hypothetical protein